MAQILVRGLEPEDVDELRLEAKAHKRSVEAEARLILREALQRARVRKRALEDGERLFRDLQGRHFTDSADLIREDRDR